eukprot:CAMPEP_0118936094 /NCGR_PEP_ID=MMETSP1169-20130426/16003_1 /TAXON_ID=36882 /ORGANISM="Pyramimonas obovata, Strain CCMP722" /LENGTH=335 /DNA_ID=CAMNT_0006879205 /DNA_START=278 /DNA_END=1281 /DNA_ORIENTATION=-
MVGICKPEDGESESILLYYKYASLEAPAVQLELRVWMEQLCRRLDLRGRVRVALDGLNVTVRGKDAALQEHMRQVAAHPALKHGSPIDFKLAPAEPEPLPAMVLETGMDRLSVRACREVVSMGPRAGGKAAHLSMSGQHMPPAVFHQTLEEASKGEKGVVVVDARNVYESRIGRFEVPGVRTVSPPVRCFTALPEWIDAHEGELKGKQILMYCTGGVRCERASAYIRSKGAGFEDVAQLSGGIHRYLEAFPDGGLFRGKNFVFDERSAVGPGTPADDTPLGACLMCAAPWDDYRLRDRCHRCRMLVLVCDACRPKLATPGGLAEELMCELCQSTP